MILGNMSSATEFNFYVGHHPAVVVFTSRIDVPPSAGRSSQEAPECVRGGQLWEAGCAGQCF